jgi:cell division initiation protein
MELTSEVLRDVQFRQTWKGYDTAEVDDFLDSITSGVGLLNERLKAAIDRAEKAEARSTSGAPVVRSESDESVRRTLVLAQRAADLVVSEAKSVSDRIVADAHDQAAQIVAAARTTGERIEQDAQQRASQVLSESEAAAERITATKAAELQGSLSGLVEEQGRRRFELDQLRQQVEGYRAQLRSELEAQMKRLENISVSPPPLVDLGMDAQQPEV